MNQRAGLGVSIKEDSKRYTAADIEVLTYGAVDRKMAENWHNRSLWLTPGESPPRGKPRLYSVAHLFEAMTRAALVEGGFTHAAARNAIELRLTNEALNKERKRQREESAEIRVVVLAKDVPREIYSLPELKKPEEDWYWAIYFGYYGKKVSELESTIAFKGNLPVSEVLEISRVASVVHISAIVRDVFAYVEQGGRRD
jgi:hypothetical protein